MPQLTSLPVSYTLFFGFGMWMKGASVTCHIPFHSRVLNLGKAEQDAVNSLIAVSMHTVNP